MKHKLQKPAITPLRWEERALSDEVLQDLIQETLAKGVALRIHAKGQSMLPFIQSGDKLTIEPLGTSPISIGKVVLFYQPQSKRLLIHRIIARRKQCYLIKADNSGPDDDGWLTDEAVLGCVAAIERAGRKIRFGLGPERWLIAFLSKRALLTRITSFF